MWHEEQFESIVPVREWHEVQEPEFGCLATGGCVRKLLRACASEMGAGEKAFV